MDGDDDILLRFIFEAEIIYWRGPSPFFYAPLPADRAEDVRNLARVVTYGWGMIPVEATIAAVAFTTALFRKDDTYLLPLKDVVRKKAAITAGDRITAELTLRPPRR
jgi:hypothetical protein